MADNNMSKFLNYLGNHILMNLHVPETFSKANEIYTKLLGRYTLDGYQGEKKGRVIKKRSKSKPKKVEEE
jgi:hypothetical protein